MPDNKCLFSGCPEWPHTECDETKGCFNNATEAQKPEAVKSKSNDGLNAETAQKLLITVQTFLHDIEDHNDHNGPILMSSNMWLQVEAMRKLTKSI